MRPMLTPLVFKKQTFANENELVHNLPRDRNA